jgi:hypothetical protein
VLKETELDSYKMKQYSGFNINNFVNTFDFDVVVIKQKSLLFLSYLDFFHVIHTKHFKRFSKKMKLMNDYLDEDIKFDEELQHREDDSLKSSASTSSLESNEDIEKTQSIDKSSIKSLFKSNVKKGVTSLNNINHISHNYLSPIKNLDINNMLASLSQSFDADINDIKLDTSYVPSTIETILEKPVTINAQSLEKISDTYETINVATDGLEMDSPNDISDSIYGHKIIKETDIIETIETALNLTQMVDIFNAQDDLEEDAEVSEDLSKGELDKEEPNTTNKKKKKKKKKKQ